MVAPSFQTYKVIVAEPFLKNGKLYITVEHPNTKNHRDVRWYSDREYARAYGNKSKDNVTPERRKIYKPAEVQSLEVLSTSPLTLKAEVAGDPRIAYVLIWQAYEAMIQNKEV